MRKMLPAVLAALVIGTGAAAAQTNPQGGPTDRPTWSAQPPDLPIGVGGEATWTADDVRAMLQAEGYTNVSDVTREGEIYNAMATKDGTNRRLSVDARDGRVLASVDAP